MHNKKATPTVTTFQKNVNIENGPENPLNWVSFDVSGLAATHIFPSHGKLPVARFMQALELNELHMGGGIAYHEIGSSGSELRVTKLEGYSQETEIEIAIHLIITA
jgi:hypothetical protein